MLYIHILRQQFFNKLFTKRKLQSTLRHINKMVFLYLCLNMRLFYNGGRLKDHTKEIMFPSLNFTLTLDLNPPTFNTFHLIICLLIPAAHLPTCTVTTGVDTFFVKSGRCRYEPSLRLLENTSSIHKSTVDTFSSDEYGDYLFGCRRISMMDYNSRRSNSILFWTKIITPAFTGLILVYINLLARL